MPPHVAIDGPFESDAERIERLEHRILDLEQRLKWLWELSRHRFLLLAGAEDELGSYEDGGR